MSKDNLNQIESKVSKFKTRTKKPKNRKHTSTKPYYLYKGHEYKVYKKDPLGLYTPILRSSLDLLYFARDKWRRVFLVRFDLHHVGMCTLDNSHLSNFNKNLSRRLERRYISKPLYLWVREIGKENGGQHYHCFWLIDGNKARHSKRILDIAKETWERMNDCYTFSPSRNPYYFIDTRGKMEEAVKRVSYLAKASHKGGRPVTTNDYNSSPLKRKNLIKR